MKLPHLLSRALTFTSTQPHHRALHPQTYLQSSLYFSTRQPRKQPNKPNPPNPTLPPPPPPPPPPTQSPPSSHNEFPSASNTSWQLDKVEEVVTEWKRPSEIPFQAKVANSVNLIGYVAEPVRMFWSSDGRASAGTILTQETPYNLLWIPIIFEGDLAHVAACHLKEKDFVHVSGQLTGDPPQVTTEQGQTNIQVMVHNLSFVQQSFPRKETQTSYKQEEKVTTFPSKDDSDTTGKLWIDLLAYPSKWWDNRSSKIDPTGADFRRKDSSERLWIDGSTPGWIISKLDSLNFINPKVENIMKSVSGANDPESSWKDLVDNPTQWWDNRAKKHSGQISSKFPDFKRKDGGLPLWLNQAPGWVLSKFEDAKLKDQVESAKLKDPYKKSQQKENKDDSWKSVIENPEKWWDNRSTKRNPKGPDFKHKETGEALWLSTSPAWVLPKLPREKPKDVVFGKRETLLS